MKNWKQYLPDILAVLLFAVISFAYFFPADIDGKVLYRHDSSAGRGMGLESSEYYDRTGEVTRWTGSVFCGMPTYQITPRYKSLTALTDVVDIYHLGLPENVWFLFVYLLGFYIMLRAFNFKTYLAALGSVVWAFSSYFLIIIAAGHLWKVMALAYLPPMIGGIVLAYRGKYLWGLFVTSLFTAFEIYANHVQMTYYYMFIILFMVIAYLVDAIRKKQMAHFLKATGICAAGAVIGLCLNISNLYHTWEYSKESMRGKSELVKKNSGNQTDSGLERDYITQWSYGIDETWTLLVPNTKGGASVPLTQSETAMKKADNQFIEVYQQLGQYWGDQPMTSGPVYVGAFVLMLFFLGAFIVKGPIKWALLAATYLSIMLAWGRNFMPLTDFFIDYIPMYSKFRTVASILVIAEFTIPLLAMLGLKEIIDNPKLLDEPEEKKSKICNFFFISVLSALVRKKRDYILVGFLMTAGVALLFALMPTLFFNDFISANEMQALSQIPAEYLNPLLANLREMREAVFTADCWRSLFIIVLGTLFLVLFLKKKLNAKAMVGLMCALCLIDMWQIDKRYLNNDMFVEKSARETPIRMTETDKLILRDKTECGNYRVLNFATSTFNENETSYYHKSLGGYHAAKLRRYQEMVEHYIQPEMGKAIQAVANAGGDMTKVDGRSLFPVISMLNAKYFIIPLQQSGQTVPVMNPYALGPAWFVDKVDFVDNANEEIDRIGKIDLRHEAVADKKFAGQIGKAVRQDGNSLVTITSYEPNELKYDVSSDKGGVIVFSEVYYPGWTATVDGKPVEMGRVNYILRAINVAPGSHKVVLTFRPATVKATETIAYIGYALLLVTLVLLLWREYRKKKAEEKESSRS